MSELEISKQEFDDWYSIENVSAKGNWDLRAFAWYVWANAWSHCTHSFCDKEKIEVNHDRD